MMKIGKTNLVYISDDIVVYFTNNNEVSEEIRYKNLKTNEVRKITNGFSETIACDGENIYFYGKDSSDDNYFIGSLNKYNIITQ